MAVVAVVHVVLAIVGFSYIRSFPVGPAAAEAAPSAHIFGIFETNGWHNLAAVGVALFAIYFTWNPGRVRTAALLLGLFHVGVTISLVIWEPSTFWIASNAADQVIHAATAIGGIVFGLTPGKAMTDQEPSFPGGK